MDFQRYKWFPEVFAVLSAIPTSDSVTISDIMRSTGITYSHGYKLVQLLESKKLVILHSVGRCCEVSLTKKGLYILGLYEDVVKGLG